MNMHRAKFSSSKNFLSLALSFLFISAFPVCLALAQITNATHRWLGYQGLFKKYGRNPPKEVRNAAEGGDANAMFALFVANDTDYYPSISASAIEWLKKAAEAGHPEAQVYLGDCYENREKPNDMPQAVHWYRLSADQGHAGGQYKLGLCYLKGQGVERDEERALQLIRMSADQGQLYALVRLSDLYARGIGESRNKNDGKIELLKRAAARGFPDAYSTLVARYKSGFGTDRDLIVAAKWQCEGAALNPSRFRIDKKEIYSMEELRKRETPFEKITSLFLQAVTKKDPAAISIIAQMYADGKNVPRSPGTAWQWFNFAASQGSSDAATHRAEMEGHMAADELAQAKAQASAFITELTALANRLNSQRGVSE